MKRPIVAAVLAVLLALLPAAGAEDLLPVYLRLSQAERERQERMEANQNQR